MPTRSSAGSPSMPALPPLPQRSDSLPNAHAPPVPPIPAKLNSPSRHRHPRQDSGHQPSPASPRLAMGDVPPMEGNNQDALQPWTAWSSVSSPASSVSSTVSAYMFEKKNLYQESFKTLLEFYEKGMLCDVKICVGSKTIPCHRTVLACCSEYFRAMFMSDLAESHQDSVTIHDLDPTAMEQLIRFCYTARIELTITNVQPILFAASILQIETVAEACCDFMKSHLHPSNCIEVRDFAEQHNRVQLMKTADEYILEHFVEVMETEEFLLMSRSLLESLVASADLNVDSEEQVYQAIIKWVKRDEVLRTQHMPSLIAHVKLPLMSAQYLMETVAGEELIRSSHSCRDYLDDAKYYQMALVSLIPDVKITERMRPRKSYAGVLFCVGGRGSSGDPFKSIECYDPRRNRWFHVAEMNTRRRHVGVCSAKGLLYAVGGHDGCEHLSSGEVFDPTTNKWQEIAPMNTMRRGIALACLGGPIYAVGGLDDQSCFNIVERYDPSTDSWTYVSSMNIPRGGVAVATLKGHLYAMGGNDGVSSLDRCERFDPILDRWTPIASMNKRRAGAGVAVLDGAIYVVGGFDDNAPLDSVERYDPRTDTWTLMAKMSRCRGGVGVGALGGKLYAVGGHDGSSYLNSVEAYDTLTNTWQTVNNVQLCRAGAGVVALSGCSPLILREFTRVNVDRLHCM